MNTEEIIGSLTNQSLLEFVVRLIFNFTICFVIVRYMYYPKHKNKDFVFTFILFNTVNFIICFLLGGAKIKTGFAFGLFAIFSILRYRTVMVPIREMGYFFISVTLGLINALTDISSKEPQSIGIFLCANAVILLLIFILDRPYSLQHENRKLIYFEKIELIKPELRTQLLKELQNRTGLPIHRVEIVRLDYARDIARIMAFYYSDTNESSYATLADEED